MELGMEPRYPDSSRQPSQHLQVLCDIRESRLFLPSTPTSFWDAATESHRSAFGLCRVGRLILEFGHQGPL